MTVAFAPQGDAIAFNAHHANALTPDQPDNINGKVLASGSEDKTIKLNFPQEKLANY